MCSKLLDVWSNATAISPTVAATVRSNQLPFQTEMKSMDFFSFFGRKYIEFGS